MALDAGTMIKKYHVALFLNGGTTDVPEWKQIKKSTDNTITMNAETQTFDYITDEAPTTEINGMLRAFPSLSQCTKASRTMSCLTSLNQPSVAVHRNLHGYGADDPRIQSMEGVPSDRQRTRLNHHYRNHYQRHYRKGNR